MLAKQVSIDAAALGDPDHAVWSGAASEEIQLAPTPLELQPSLYLSKGPRDRAYGRVRRLRVRALHNQKEIAFLLEWEDPRADLVPADDDVFPDGAALLFPLRGDAPLITMGSPDAPVAAWHWRADRPGHGRSNVAQGLGTTRVVDEQVIATNAAWSTGRWRLVLTRPLRVTAAEAESIQIRVGEPLKVAFAVWEGSNGERGGLKSFSPSWHEVTLEGGADGAGQE